jgi:hypothetical protein
MSNVQIPNLPAATGLSGSEQFEGVQSGTSVRISASQIAAYIDAAYPAPGIASVSGSAPIAVSTVGNAATVSLDLQGVTNAYMATMAAGTVKANVTGGSASPTDATVSQVLDTIGSTKGMMLYRDTTSWVALTSGTNGQVLTAQGTTAAPIWATLSVPSGQIAPTGVVSGTYGSASSVPQYTVLASGQLSAASNVPIVIPDTSVTGLGTMATQNANAVAITGGAINGTPIGASTPSTGAFTSLSASGNASLSTVTSGTWNGTAIGVAYGGTGATTASGARTNLGAAASGANSDITSLSGLTTPLSAPQGGTGFGSYTTGDLLYANTSSTLARLNDVATGNALISGGGGVGPFYGKIGLTTHVSGTLPVANGGSGATTLTGFLKGNGTSAFTAQATIGNADLTNSSITVGSTSIALGATSTTLAGLTTVTLTQDPTAALEAATKQYVDNEVLSVSNTTFHTSSGYATTADLGTVTYSNGTSGVGATITQSGSPSVLIIDGYTFTASDVSNATRVLVKNQSSGLQNGIYTVANEGSGAANWQLIRATDFNTVGTGPNRVQTGASTFVTGGAANGSTGWVMNVDGTIIIGTTALVWVQSSSSSSVTVTSPLTKVGSVISLGTVPATLGGTGLTTLTQYGVMLGNGTGNVAFASPGTSGLPLLSTGASSNPAFGQLSLTAGVTGTLPVTNGGTGTATALTAGSVVFAGASGVYSQNNAEFFWNNTNDFLGLGTASPDTRLTITAPTQTSVTAGTLPAGTDLHIVGADSAITRITQDAFGTGNYPAYTGRAARGTAASPTATQSGDVLSQYGGRGRGATDYSSTSVARIDLEAAENFTDTAQGSFISLHTTALGAASPVERFRAGPSGQWGIGGANYGSSGQVFTSAGASAAPTWTAISVTSVAGTLPVANGGTGLTSYTVGDLLYADGTTSIAKLADVATGNALISGGVGVAPSYGKIGLTTHVSGTLPIGNGGTGIATTPTNGQLLIGNGTNYSLATLTASTGISVTNGSGTITLANTGVTSLTAGSANITLSASTGGVTIDLGSSPSVSGLSISSGNLTFGGSAQRILGDFSASTQANRLLLQTSVTNGFTNIGALPNGSGTGSALRFYSTSDADNSSVATIISGGGTNTVSLQSAITGTGTYIPMTFFTGGSERMRIDTSGNLIVGNGATSATPANGVVEATDGSGTNIAGASLTLQGGRGTGTGAGGSLIFQTAAAGSSGSSLNSASTRMTIDTSGNVSIATGNLDFSSTSQRVTGDFSNATTASRTLFQSSTGTFTDIGALSPGASQSSGWTSYFGNDPTNTSRTRMLATSTDARLESSITGTGTYVPLTFYTGGSERVRIDTAGQITVNAGTVSAPVIAPTGDTNTGIFFPAADTIAFAEGGVEALRLNSSGQVVTTAGTVSLPAITTTGDTNTGIFFPAADTIAFAEGGVEAMRIDSAGNVGIGTSSPSYPITISRSGVNTYLYQFDGTGAMVTGSNGSGLGVSGTFSNTAFALFANSTERFQIGTSGQFGIGGANYGTSGQVLTSGGSGAAPSWAAPATSVINVQTFDASGTWTKPSGYSASSRVFIECWGGGGSGSRVNATNSSLGNGGGGGGYNSRWLTLSQMGATETITVGAGGAATTAAGNGNTGGNSSVGSLITAYGGGGASATTNAKGFGGGQLSAGSSSVSGTPQFGAGGCDVQGASPGTPAWITGGGGGTNAGAGTSSVWGGGGGGGGFGTVATNIGGTSSFAGNGGAGSSASGVAGVAGTAPGGAGGAGNNANSGAGAAGRVIITVFPA